MFIELFGLVSESEGDKGNWEVKVGELVWGAALGSPAWPGKVESFGPPGSFTVSVRWYGAGETLTQVEIKNLKSLSDGLEAHHRARKRFRKSRKLNMQLENAIQEAMAELDNLSDSDTPNKIRKQFVQSTQSSKTSLSSTSHGKNRNSDSKKNKKLSSSQQKVVPKCR
ncbi:hypothetical protein G9C98_005929 [Cotesia typhae]|uniref:PWWP domain-containing protein n=1 Tax=Cotesia typhae TaxID=2053667 RepID=A0A8J5R3M4_9HYME|nr:hypothetical protein G9C98_005929 [Cotesia typhae]